MRISSRNMAEIYLKGRTEILKKNFLIRFANHLFPLDWRDDDQFFELVTNSRYNAPNNFVHSVKAVNANTIPNQKKQLEALTFLNINVYSQTAYDEAIFMPTAKNAFRHYRSTGTRHTSSISTPSNGVPNWSAEHSTCSTRAGLSARST